MSHLIDSVVFFSLEMLDRIEPPNIPDGYSLSLAFLCLLDVVGCVQNIINGQHEETLDDNSMHEQPASPLESNQKHMVSCV